jgi:hypothetical protein
MLPTTTKKGELSPFLTMSWDYPSTQFGAEQTEKGLASQLAFDMSTFADNATYSKWIL